MTVHECEPIEMGYPARTVCGRCGHDQGCTIHGGSTPCRNWRTECPPAAEEGVTMETLWQHEKRRAERAEAAMEANIATLELCQEAVVELERKLYLAGTDLIGVRDQRDAARTERNALRAENEQMRAALRLASPKEVQSERRREG